MRRQRIPGSRTAVWRLFQRHKISFKKVSGTSFHAARRLRSGLEACRHPVLTHLFDDGRNVLVGYSAELFGFRPLPGRAEHRAPLIVDAVEHDRQQQTVIDVGEIPERCPRRQSHLHCGVEALAPWTRIDVVVRLTRKDRFKGLGCVSERLDDRIVTDRHGRDRRELRRPTMIERVDPDAADFE